MKKIIATVLAMVMALALCTTAFAAETKTLEIKDYKLLNMTTNEEIPLTGGKTLVYHSESKSTTTVDGKTTVSVTAAYYELKDASNASIGVAVVVDQGMANAKVVTGGKVVDYVYSQSGVTFTEDLITTDKTVTKTIAGVKDAKCGQYAGDGKTFYVIDGKVYEAVTTYTVNDTGVAMLNGKLVAYALDNSQVAPQDHVFDTTKVNSSNGVVTAVYCTKCEAYIPVVTKIPADATAKYGSVVITTKVGQEDKAVTYYYQIGATGTAAGTTTGTTTSPKTFDAGIAMYVGMALTSVAGSAVVIGKKKEF